MAANPFDTPYRGGLVGRAHHYALTVFFEDTDAYGIVYYANYLKFMERARSDMLRSVDIDQAAELAASGSAYAVVEANLKYRRPARLSDDIKVVSTVLGLIARTARGRCLNGRGYTHLGLPVPQGSQNGLFE